MSINKTEFVRMLADQAGMSLAKADAALKATMSIITDALMCGDEVQLTGFGSFVTAVHEAHVGRNPSTNEEIHIPRRRVARFKPSIPLKRALMDKVV